MNRDDTNWEELFHATDKQRRQVSELLQKVSPLPEAGSFFDPDYTEERYVPVEDGRIRLFHHHPDGKAGGIDVPEASIDDTAARKSARPVVFLPGWGTVPEGFIDFFETVNRRIETYYVETREKNSSQLDRKRARLDLDSTAADVQTVLDELGLSGRDDFVLMSTCWGSTILAHGLAKGFIKAPTVVLFDPMHSLWFPKWILRFILPYTPLLFWRMIRPIGKRIALLGMKEETQKRRAEMFVDRAILWKWKRAAIAVRDIELYESVSEIEQEVFVFNGVKDKIHSPTHYPRLAALMPRARFFYLPTDESQREHLLGVAAVEFGKVTAEEGPPPPFRQFEKKIR